MIFFTSDTHFGHKSVIRFCKRPFTSVEEMDEAMISRWNAVVGKCDVIYHLGDVSFYGATKTREILSRLNGYKILIRGNHDDKERAMVNQGFQAAFDSGVISHNGAIFRLSHFPYKGQEHDKRDFSEKALDDHGDWLLHGHVHDVWLKKNKMINVGVDKWEFAPVSIDEILEAK